MTPTWALCATPVDQPATDRRRQPRTDGPRHWHSPSGRWQIDDDVIEAVLGDRDLRGGGRP